MHAHRRNQPPRARPVCYPVGAGSVNAARPNTHAGGNQGEAGVLASPRKPSPKAGCLFCYLRERPLGCLLMAGFPVANNCCHACGEAGGKGNSNGRKIKAGQVGKNHGVWF